MVLWSLRTMSLMDVILLQEGWNWRVKFLCHSSATGLLVTCWWLYDVAKGTLQLYGPKTSTTRHPYADKTISLSFPAMTTSGICSKSILDARHSCCLYLICSTQQEQHEWNRKFSGNKSNPKMPASISVQ